MGRHDRRRHIEIVSLVVPIEKFKSNDLISARRWFCPCEHVCVRTNPDGETHFEANDI